MDTSGRCCLLSTSRGRPVHLWDAVSGTLRASYVGFNHLDEVDAANSVVFEPSGRFIYAGYERAVRVFDVTRPGRAIETRPTAATRKSIITFSQAALTRSRQRPQRCAACRSFR